MMVVLECWAEHVMFLLILRECLPFGNRKVNCAPLVSLAHSATVSHWLWSTNLKEAELVWSLVGANDQGLDVANIDIATSDGQGWRSINRAGGRRVGCVVCLQRSEFL